MHTDKYDSYQLIFSLADGGSLHEYLKTKSNDLTWEDKYKLGLGITDGLQYLHKLDIVHKNLVFIVHAVRLFVLSEQLTLRSY